MADMPVLDATLLDTDPQGCGALRAILDAAAASRTRRQPCEVALGSPGGWVDRTGSVSFSAFHRSSPLPPMRTIKIGRTLPRVTLH
jgi:hypothetical protein